MLESISNWVLKNILYGLSELCQQVLIVFGDVFDNIFVSVAEFNNTVTRGITDFTLPFSVVFICFMAVWQYLTIYVFETNGDPDSEPIDIFVRASQAVAIAVSADTICNFFLDFSGTFVSDLQGFVVDNSSSSTGIRDALSDLLSVPENFASIPSVVIVLTVGIIIALIVFIISAGIRGAELSLFKLLFPIFAADLITTSRERWNNFFMSYIVTWLAYGLQIISFKMFGTTILGFITCNVDDFWKILSVSIGWLILMIRSPRWLEKFVYTSGISNGIKGVGRSAVYFGMMMRR